MTDADFMAVICADRAADAPRLIYADWLEERGDAARAEFIRVQIELAKYGAYICPSIAPRQLLGAPSLGGCCCCWHKLSQRNAELLHRDYEPVLGVRSRHRQGNSEYQPYGLLPGISGFAVDWADFKRGFCYRVECTGSTWLAFADILCTQPIEEVKLLTYTTFPVLQRRLMLRDWPRIKFILPYETDAGRGAHGL